MCDLGIEGEWQCTGSETVQSEENMECDICLLAPFYSSPLSLPLQTMASRCAQGRVFLMSMCAVPLCLK